MGTQGTKGTVVVNPDGTWTYTPTTTSRHNAAATGASAADKTDTFTITVSDGHGGTATTQTISVTITPDNTDPTAPTVNQVGQTDPSTGATTYQPGGSTDADSDQITYTATSTSGTVVKNGNGTFTYTPTNPASDGTITFYADDGHGGVASQAFIHRAAA